MSVAAETRRAVREDTALYDALRAGIVNYSAAARSLDVAGDEESIATALRRFADELEPVEDGARRVSVRLHRSVALNGAEDGVDLETSGDATAIEVTGDVDQIAFEAVLGRFRTADIEVSAASLTGETIVVAVEDRSGADALRATEDALEAA